MEILEFTRKEAAAPLMSEAAPLWFWKFREKIQNLGFFFENFENYGKSWKISNNNFQIRRQIREAVKNYLADFFR